MPQSHEHELVWHHSHSRTECELIFAGAIADLGISVTERPLNELPDAPTVVVFTWEHQQHAQPSTPA